MAFNTKGIHKEAKETSMIKTTIENARKVFTLSGTGVYLKAHTDDPNLNEKLEEVAFKLLAQSLYDSHGFVLHEEIKKL